LQVLGRGIVDFGTADGTKTVEPGQSVLLAGGYSNGGTAGSVYKRKIAAASIALGSEDYSVTASWELEGTNAAFIALTTENRDIHDAVPDPGANIVVDDKIVRTVNRTDGIAI
jgi:hypothetical protein